MSCNSSGQVISHKTFVLILGKYPMNTAFWFGRFWNTSSKNDPVSNSYCHKTWKTKIQNAVFKLYNKFWFEDFWVWDSLLVFGQSYFLQNITKETLVGLMTFWLGFIKILSYADLCSQINLKSTNKTLILISAE